MLLPDIKSPADIKDFSQKELTQLAKECRKTIIDVVGKNGGHLASNLGVVELTIALHRVFNSPRDAIIWDVSHQCYTHKLLTGRYNQFSTIRTRGGLSGFTNTEESEHDFFINGHSSTSISSALGLLTARRISGQEGKVIAVIGDGALTGGMAFEGLSHAGQLCNDLIVVLNDNQMSIDHNTGALSRYLSRMTSSFRYQSFRNNIDKIVNHIPFINRLLRKMIFRFKRAVKALFYTNNLFVELGFEYTGPIDGHNEKELEKVFRRVSRLHQPVVVHVITKKGKGYSPAENKPDVFHGIGPFQTSDGTVEKFDTTSFTEAFGNMIVEAAENNKKIAAITAAMAKGTGLTAFSHRFPDRFFDVGIAEEHAVTFAGGLAAGGMIPVVCIYSTFIQRAVDQLIHDVSLQNLHVIFMLDRAGAVPNDGVTHQGCFDIALFRPVPNLQILSPCSENDLRLCFDYALNNKGAFVIRYPKLSCPTEIEEFSSPVQAGKGIFVPCTEFVVENITEKELLSRKKKVLIVTTGGMYSEVQKAVRSIILSGGYADILILRFIKPFDEEAFAEMAKAYSGVVFVEDGVKTGGISEHLAGLLSENKYNKTRILAFEDKYYSHGSRSDVLEMAGLSVKDIENAVNSLL
ncbi:1-deoxy-D-xylulose-5-phosphate synthase [Treponema sp. JC4]|uniref:1-deoxy-D-xylulose-5-phosphate synthase n=1 Tax=Treponema sp. JC4 TaxID=1124982 RepID=UPI00025B0527|nr:1-deoxy-D-xylulose-5-phosphate synthase [Treponema sp. JC4]EID84993.1 1-deoxy-D-xylulose-5-phosphate synthase [Treponema sp. JC4]